MNRNISLKLRLFRDVCNWSYVLKCVRVGMFLACPISLHLSNTEIFLNDQYCILMRLFRMDIICSQIPELSTISSFENNLL